MNENHDAPALEERDWLVVWHEVLDEGARSRIRGAIRRGERLEDPNENAVALERVKRLRSVAPRAAAMMMVAWLLVIAFAFVLVELPANAYFWRQTGFYALLVLLAPVLAWLRTRRLDRVSARLTRVE